jgi:hypothetical protein
LFFNQALYLLPDDFFIINDCYIHKLTPQIFAKYLVGLSVLYIGGFFSFRGKMERNPSEMERNVFVGC